MAVVRKKQDDKYLKVLRELVNTGGGNRQCFDCGQKGPTYVNMTIGSFVCTRCSGVVRGLTPPHRVKSISMATFTQEEIDFLKAHGNDLCAKTWLGLWDPKRAVHQDHRELMIDKYERKRYYLEPASPLKSLTNAASLTKTNAPSSAAATSTQNDHSNGNAPPTNGYYKQQNTIDNNNFQNIQLTPPASQRNTANGLHKASATAISRPQHTQNQPLQNGYAHHHQQHQDAFMMVNNCLNGLPTTINGLNTSVGSSSTAASTSALSDTSSCASANGFGPDADFVADFGSATIFDATSTSSICSPAVSSASSVASSNGYAKIQPIKAVHQQQLQQQQHHQFMNGNVVNSKLHVNGTSSLSNSGVDISRGNTENFADFDHAPIFNAAANYQFVRKTNVKKKCPVASNLQHQKQHKKKQQLSNINDTNELFANLKQPTKTTTTIAAVNVKNESNGNSDTIKSPPDIRFSESTTNFNDPFDDFSTIIKNNNNKNSHSMSNFATTFESDYNDAQQIQSLLQREQQQQPQSQATSSSMKFTPLAMAAHATAMAVLGSNYHYNSSNHAGSVVVDSNLTAFQSDNHCNVWQEPILNSGVAALDESTSTPTTPMNSNARGSNSSVFTPNSHAAASTPFIVTASTAPSDMTRAASLSMSSSDTKSSYPTAPSFSSSNPFRRHFNEYSDLHSNCDSDSVPVGIFARNCNSPSSSVDENSNSYCDSFPYWSLPIPNGSTATSCNAFNNNNNSKLSSTPGEDRYAALKDLDEQLRESKVVPVAVSSAVAVDSFGNNANNNNNSNLNSNVNPFKSQQQNATMVNPFQHGTQPSQQNLFGQLAVLSNEITATSTAATTNSLAAAHQTQQQPQQTLGATGFFNYSNGLTVATSGGGVGVSGTMFSPTMIPSSVGPMGGPNGCGFGFGTMQQQIAATGGGISSGVFNNPFAAATGALNSNNPFL